MAKIKCVVLLPLVRNDRSPVTPVELKGILHEFLDEFGGYTVAGEVEGGWRSPEGIEYRDRNTQVWLAIEQRAISKLRRMLIDIGRRLGQEAMYLEVTGAKVDIIHTAARGAVKKK